MGGADMSMRWVARLVLFAVLVVSIGAAGSPATRAFTGASQVDSGGAEWASLNGVVSPQTNLFRVFMLGANDAWASGDTLTGSQITFRVFKLEYRAGRWLTTYTHDFPRRVEDIVAVSDDNVWVVG